MAHPPNLIAALALADDLVEILDAGVPARHQDPGLHEKGIAALDAAVKRHDPHGRLDPFGSEYMLRACGYRSTSTMGLTGACLNWIAQVRRKTGGQ